MATPRGEEKAWLVGWAGEKAMRRHSRKVLGESETEVAVLPGSSVKQHIYMSTYQVV